MSSRRSFGLSRPSGKNGLKRSDEPVTLGALGCAGRGKAGGQANQGLRHDQRVDRFFDAEHTHLRTALRCKVDDPHGRQCIESLADRATAYPVRGGELRFLQTLAGLIATVIKAVDDVPYDGLPCATVTCLY